jgi:hypothetical protein
MTFLTGKAPRELLLGLLFFLPDHRKIALNRWLRGRHEFGKLRRADAVVVSFGKSGRTWFRTMLTRVYQTKHKIKKMELIGFYNFHKYHPSIPRLFFTHDNYIRDYTGNCGDKSDFYAKKVLFLVRDPRDVAVSSYFQRKFRGNPLKTGLRDVEVEGNGPSMFEFVMIRLPLIIEFMNEWHEETPKIRDMQVIRYEDLRADPGSVLAKALDFLGTPGTKEEVDEAVSFAAYDNMKKLEADGSFGRGDRRINPGDRNNPDSFKVRRAKIGGYRDYFSDEEVRQIDALVDTTLAADFGYGVGQSRQAQG